MFYSSNQITNHSTPSISGGKKSTSGRRLVIIAALPRIRWRDILCTSWLTVSLSSDPVCLAIAVPRRLSWLMAWWCMPPRVSRAIGRKTSPCCLQASAVSRIFRSYAWSRAPPWRAVAAARLELARGLVTVTSRAASFPSLHLQIKTSPGLAADPGSRCRSSLAGAREALDAASKIRSRSISCLAILSLLFTQASA